MARILFRPARREDSPLLLSWRNDEATRANSRNPGLVSGHEHERWLAAVLSSPDRLLLVAEKSGRPVGVVRADRQPNASWELSWTVAPGARGHGLGKQMVSEAAVLFGDRLIAWVKHANHGSEAIARAAGLERARDEGGFSLWCSRAALQQHR